MTRKLAWARLLLGVASALVTSSCGPSMPAEADGKIEQALIDGGLSPPDQNAVVVLFNSDIDWCTGVVVAPNLVLTSRHFLFDANPWYLNCGEGGKGSVLVGQANDPTTYGISVGNKKPRTLPVYGKRIYAGSDLDLCHNDLALVELETPLAVTPLPMRLDGPTEVGEQGTLVGWGEDTDPLAADPELKHLTVIDERQQLSLEVDAMPDPDNGKFTTTQGGCFGDNGAPFISKRTGAVVALMSTIEPVNPVTNLDIPNFSACIGATDVFQTLSSQADWIRDAFAQAGQSVWLEGLSQPAELGGSCQVDAECISGLCVGTGSARFCSTDCSSTPCPEGLQCLGGSQKLCVPAQASDSAVTSSSCTLAGPENIGTPWGALSLPIISLFLRSRRRHSHSPNS
jgi:hypothetical protein